jgi:hypothetical protein
MAIEYELRHPKEGHSLLALIAPTPAFRSAHQSEISGPHLSLCFWVQLDQGENVKRSALGESLRSEDARVETANAKGIAFHHTFGNCPSLSHLSG